MSSTTPSAPPSLGVGVGSSEKKNKTSSFKVAVVRAGGNERPRDTPMRPVMPSSLSAASEAEKLQDSKDTPPVLPLVVAAAKKLQPQVVQPPEKKQQQVVVPKCPNNNPPLPLASPSNGGEKRPYVSSDEEEEWYARKMKMIAEEQQQKSKKKAIINKEASRPAAKKSTTRATVTAGDGGGGAAAAKKEQSAAAGGKTPVAAAASVETPKSSRTVSTALSTATPTPTTTAARSTKTERSVPPPPSPPAVAITKTAAAANTTTTAAAADGKFTTMKKTTMPSTNDAAASKKPAAIGAPQKVMKEQQMSPKKPLGKKEVDEESKKRGELRLQAPVLDPSFAAADCQHFVAKAIPNTLCGHRLTDPAHRLNNYLEVAGWNCEQAAYYLKEIEEHRLCKQGLLLKVHAEYHHIAFSGPAAAAVHYPMGVEPSAKVSCAKGEASKQLPPPLSSAIPIKRPPVDPAVSVAKRPCTTTVYADNITTTVNEPSDRKFVWAPPPLAKSRRLTPPLLKAAKEPLCKSCGLLPINDPRVLSATTTVTAKNAFEYLVEGAAVLIFHKENKKWKLARLVRDVTEKTPTVRYETIKSTDHRMDGVLSVLTPFATSPRSRERKADYVPHNYSMSCREHKWLHLRLVNGLYFDFDQEDDEDNGDIATEKQEEEEEVVVVEDITTIMSDMVAPQQKQKKKKRNDEAELQQEESFLTQRPAALKLTQKEQQSSQETIDLASSPLRQAPSQGTAANRSSSSKTIDKKIVKEMNPTMLKNLDGEGGETPRWDRDNEEKEAEKEDVQEEDCTDEQILDESEADESEEKDAFSDAAASTDEADKNEEEKRLKKNKIKAAGGRDEEDEEQEEDTDDDEEAYAV